MMRFFVALFAVLFAGAAQAQTLPDSMAGVAFLIGDWGGTKTSADTLAIAFEMQPPGAAAFVPVAQGTVTRK